MDKLLTNGKNFLKNNNYKDINNTPEKYINNNVPNFITKKLKTSSEKEKEIGELDMDRFFLNEKLGDSPVQLSSLIDNSILERGIYSPDKMNTSPTKSIPNKENIENEEGGISSSKFQEILDKIQPVSPFSDDVGTSDTEVESKSGNTLLDSISKNTPNTCENNDDNSKGFIVNCINYLMEADKGTTMEEAKKYCSDPNNLPLKDVSLLHIPEFGRRGDDYNPIEDGEILSATVLANRSLSDFFVKCLKKNELPIFKSVDPENNSAIDYSNMKNLATMCFNYPELFQKLKENLWGKANHLISSNVFLQDILSINKIQFTDTNNTVLSFLFADLENASLLNYLNELLDQHSNKNLFNIIHLLGLYTTDITDFANQLTLFNGYDFHCSIGACLIVVRNLITVLQPAMGIPLTTTHLVLNPLVGHEIFSSDTDNGMYWMADSYDRNTKDEDYRYIKTKDHRKQVLRLILSNGFLVFQSTYGVPPEYLFYKSMRALCKRFVVTGEKKGNTEYPEDDVPPEVHTWDL